MEYLDISNRISCSQDSEYPTVDSLDPPDTYFGGPTEIKRAIHMHQDFHALI